MAEKKYVIGLDYGTNSVRALIVETHTGAEISSHEFNYPHGQDGVIIDSKDSNLARQHPQDYLDGAEQSIKGALEQVGPEPGFSADKVIGIGIDTTGSTPLPITESNVPLAFLAKFADRPAAMAWLWKDHTSFAEAARINAIGQKERPQYLAKVGGTYSSEWFWAKILHCVQEDREVFDAAYSWIEIADWIPAVLCGITDPCKIKRGICAAGHKGLFNPEWKGYPDKDFLTAVGPELVRIRKSLPDIAYTVDQAVGTLSPEWSGKTGLPAGIPVAVGAFDAHLGGIGAGIKPGTLVKIIGTSTCDMMVAPETEKLPDIPGLCGIVPGSILPGNHGMEAGQSAVGDIFNWFVQYIQPGGKESGTHQQLTERAEKLKPGESGLLALDWWNGNRTILVDQRLTGSIFGLTLHSTPAEIYRALVEATAFGARVIMERFEEYEQKVQEIINCGGISAKNKMVMQIYADIMGRPIKISRSAQTSALGAAMAGAVVAGEDAGGYKDFQAAIAAMTGTLDEIFTPIPEHVETYNRLYSLYRQLHDHFGTREVRDNLFNVMKDLLDIKDKARQS